MASEKLIELATKTPKARQDDELPKWAGYDEKGNLKREAKRDNPLKLGHEIANKDILEKR